MDVDFTGRRMKIFLVDMDDDNREHVLSGIVDSITLDAKTEYGDIYLHEYDTPISRYPDYTESTITARLVARPDGTLFTIENFMEED